VAGVCVVNECGRGLRGGGRGYCGAHYSRLKKHGGVLAEIPVQSYNADLPCNIEGCEVVRRGGSNGLCKRHYSQKLENRKLIVGLRKPSNKFGNDGPPTYDTSKYRMLRKDGKRVLAHRLVMEEVLGRPLRGDENVHHMNGIKGDNRPGNLEIWITSQPAGQRIPDLLAWAHEIIDRYEETVNV